MKQVEVWVPHRISGFFQMMDPSLPWDQMSPLSIGSRGGGPALNAYGKTHISLLSSDSVPISNTYPIFINGIEKTDEAQTSRTVIDLMQPFFPKNVNFMVKHQFDLPLGAGYGSSGAGALGIALGLNRLFGLGLSEVEVAKYAHMADVINHTGLGTVGGQFVGGLSIMLEPGYPFQMQQVEIPSDTVVIVGSFGEISTKQILTDPEYRQLIHSVGKEAMTQMRKAYTLENFVKVCDRFLDHTQLIQRLKLSKVEQLLNTLRTQSIFGAGMNMLGESVYCFCHQKYASIIHSIFDQFQPLTTLQTLEITQRGPAIQF
jgi:pantoate kinase